MHQPLAAPERPRSRWPLALAAAVPALGAVALLPLRGTVGSTTIALILSALVVVCALATGRLGGLLAGLSGAVAFDLLHTQPYRSLAITRTQDLVTVLLMAAIGLLTGHVVSRAAAERARRERAERESLHIRSLLELQAGGEAPGRLIQVASREISALLGGAPCVYEAPPFLDRLPELGHAGVRVPAGDRGPLATPRLLQIPVRSHGETVGRFVVELEQAAPARVLHDENRAMVRAVADSLGAALS